MAALPRIAEDARNTLAPGPAMDRAVWYALRRLPRCCHPLKRWPQPRPWSTDMGECYALLTWLTAHPFLGRYWHISLAYDKTFPPAPDNPHGLAWPWTCDMSRGGAHGWSVDGYGATPMAAFCRAFLWERVPE